MIIPYYAQEKDNTCGPAALRMLLAALGIKKSEESLVKLLKTTKTKWTPNKSFSSVATHLGLDNFIKKNASISDLKKLKNNYLIILNYMYPEDNVGHFAVLRKIDSRYVYLLDPLVGPKHKYLIKDFKAIWKSGFDKDTRWLFAVKK